MSTFLYSFRVLFTNEYFVYSELGAMTIKISKQDVFNDSTAVAKLQIADIFCHSLVLVFLVVHLYMLPQLLALFLPDS